MGFKQKATVRLIGLPCDSMTCLIYIHLPALLSAARKSGVSTEFHGRSCQPWPLGHSLSISLGTISRRLTHAPPADGLVTVAPADRRHMEAPMAQRTSRLVKCLNPREPIITNPSQSFKPMNIQWFHTVSDLIFSSFTLFLLGLLKYSCGSLRDQAVQLVAYPTQRLIASPQQLVSVRPPTEFCPDNTRSDRQQSAARESMYRTSI